MTAPAGSASRSFDAPATPGATLRPTVRVVLLDPDDRILLLRMDSGVGGPVWCPPGGGIEPGESVTQAAVRELTEETGLKDAEIGPEVWRRSYVLHGRTGVWDMRERWFVCRTGGFTLDTSGFTNEERLVVSELRWWTAAELTQTEDRLVPARLAVHLADLLRDGPPPHILDVGR